MANNITKAQKYVPYLDEAYLGAAKTSILDTTREIEYIEKAGTFLVPDVEFDGLGDYDRVNGYSKGSVKNNYTPYTCDYERGKMLGVDVMDDEEAQGLIFANIAGTFVKKKVGPEVDAYRFAKYASIEGVKVVNETIAAGGEIAALRAATTFMNDNNVPMADRVLFATHSFIGAIEDLDTTKSKKVLDGFIVVPVSPAEFKTAITLGDNGYSFPEGAKDINFMVIQKDSVMQITRHATPKIISHEANQTSDEDLYGYRIIGLNNVYKNKKNGVYVSVSE
jgi:hypothetical protein